jgi:3'-phosphoadenosine 5'-phosphosulfate sulfotransferase (PAPS reductase)/FAD synthetase
MSRNPYFIEGPAQIGFSGGRSSGYMLANILDAHGGTLPDDIHVCFQNTGKEREETLEFVRDCEIHFGIEIVWLEYDDYYGKSAGESKYRRVDFASAARNGEPFERLMKRLADYRKAEKGLPPILPNPVQRLCTSYLKIKTAARYMRDSGFNHWDNIVGIRGDEPRRAERMLRPNRERWDNVIPMWHAGVTKADVNAFWKSMPFDLKLDPNSDEGNCDLCFLKAQHKLIAIIQKKPESAIWWARMENETGQVFRRDRPDYAGMIREIDFHSRQTGLFEKNEIDERIADCMCGD